MYSILFCICLVIVSIYDVKYKQILPLSYPIILILGLWDISFSKVMSSILCFVFFVILFAFEVIGAGDVKLISVCGLFFNPPLLIPLLFMTFFANLIYIMYKYIYCHATKKVMIKSVAFAPFIMIGAVTTLLFERIFL